MGNKGMAKARSEKDGPVVHFGWMKKKASNPPYQFAKRYFVANGDILEYYAPMSGFDKDGVVNPEVALEDQKLLKKGFIDLSEIIKDGIKERGATELCISLEGGRQFVVQLTTNELRQEVVDKIQQLQKSLGADDGEGEVAGEDGVDIDINEKFGMSGGKRLGADDFALVKVLGKGSFGKVMLVQKKGADGKAEGPLMAMKTLRKAALIKRNQLAHTATERSILQNIQHPFLVNLQFAFQTPDKLYMVLEYMSGGELFHWLKEHRKFSEPRARLYTAEIGLALAALHELEMVYRDLKPENLLLDADGHIRVTDFGLAKEGITTADGSGGTKTFCGTPEYLAPEILENKGHGTAVDWWSFGTLLYEMMCGLPPFYDTNVQRMYTKILSSPLRFPSYLSDEARSVLTGLLKRPVAERLGSGDTRFEEIKNHAFYKPLDFEKVYNKEYKPEFVPPTKNASSAGNFDKEFTSEKPIDSVVTSKLTPAQTDKANFEGFTFNPHANKGLDS